MKRLLAAAALALVTGAAHAQDYSGTWDVAGSDARGAYSGTALVTAKAGGYGVQRLVTYQAKLADGRELAAAWNATGKAGAGGLEVTVTLRRGHYASRVGSLRRTAAEKQPLVATGTFGGAPAVVTIGTKLTGSVAGATETWTRSNAAVPTFPVVDERAVPIHATSNVIRPLLFKVFGSYHALPYVQPYVSRPEFKAGMHAVLVDHTAKDFYRKRGRTVVVVVDKVLDAISVFEETNRANAFSSRLLDKAAAFDADLRAKHADPVHGFLAGVDASGTRFTSGDGALHQGVWVASQVFRYQVTGSAEALANVELGLHGLVTLVEITPDKSTFARAVESAAKAPQNWTRGTGAFAGLAWLPGGNNDMLHGIEYGFLAALDVLPAGNPLRARIGAAARSLVESCKVAQKGDHERFLSYVAWVVTGDAGMKKRYEKSIGWRSILEKLWLRSGDGMQNVQGISDWSGHHLGATGMLCTRLLGGKTPSSDERSWRSAVDAGLGAAFPSTSRCRETLICELAAVSKVPGALDVAKDCLDEFPYPKLHGDAEFDPAVSSEFCLSPYPALPWKLDWTKDPGRQQALVGRPTFYKDGGDNYFARNPFALANGVSHELNAGQDFVHAYWFGRLHGVFGPQD